MGRLQLAEMNVCDTESHLSLQSDLCHVVITLLSNVIVEFLDAVRLQIFHIPDLWVAFEATSRVKF